MISERTIEAITPLNDILTGRKVELLTLNESPLQQLAAASRPIQADIKNAAYSIHDIVQTSQQRDQNGVSIHDVVMEEIVSVASATVASNLNIARNTVNPIIKSVVEGVEEYLDTVNQGLLQPLSVTPDLFHQIWNNPILEGMVEQYENSPALTTVAPNGLPELTGEQLEALVLTGVSRLDSDLKQLLEDRGIEWLQSLYEAFYRPQQPGLSDNPVPLLSEALRHYNRYRDELVVAFCIAKKLSREVPEGTRADLTFFRDKVATIISQTGRAILKVYAKRDRANNNNELIVSFPLLSIDYLTDSEESIIVNGEVYNRWLKDGGSPEILFGSYVTTKERGYTALLEKADYFKEAWKRQERVIATQVRFDRFNYTLNGLNNTLTREINDLPEDELVVDRAVLHKRLKELLSGITSKDLESLYCTARKLVCRTLFAHTDVEAILTSIDDTAKANPDIDVREAALLATIEIVADWVACMIVVQSS